MQDVQLLVDAGTLQQYLRFFTTPGPNATLVYTVSNGEQQQPSVTVFVVAGSSAAAPTVAAAKPSAKPTTCICGFGSVGASAVAAACCPFCRILVQCIMVA
jgi:hypothetical protein